MTLDRALPDLVAQLMAVVQQSVSEAEPHIRAFTARLLAPTARSPVIPRVGDDDLAAATTGRFPSAAAVGFQLGSPDAPAEAAAVFRTALGRLRDRKSRSDLIHDDVALLGLAAGASGMPAGDAPLDLVWLIELIDTEVGASGWTRRARLLAGDLLDGRGRLGRRCGDDPDELALDLSLRAAWPDAYRRVVLLPVDDRRRLAHELLLTAPPPEGDVERAAARLAALDALVAAQVAGMVPDVDDLVRLLEATQASFRRWRWDGEARRKGVMPIRWLIDSEADVQAFLLAVLAPYFGKNLEDEQFLRGYGLKQPRFDFGIISLRTIIEVKVLRTSRVTEDLQTDIAEDLAFYCREAERYDRMVVYVYDDCDHPEPEKWQAVRDALRRRDKRIVDVVIVRRPSMIPDRTCRGDVDVVEAGTRATRRRSSSSRAKSG